MGAGGRNSRFIIQNSGLPPAPAPGSCEKINNLTQRHQGAKTRKEQLLCFLCAFYDLAPWREMLLLIQGLFHSFLGTGKAVTSDEKKGKGWAPGVGAIQNLKLAQPQHLGTGKAVTSDEKKGKDWVTGVGGNPKSKI